mmetsp:Transcript_57767/g.135610  ORF Transcript_57767/g.135610 Transcript_57767/m.135610 type:complete len:1366 (+) Transcript_57767:2793-6890(+)
MERTEGIDTGVEGVGADGIAAANLYGSSSFHQAPKIVSNPQLRQRLEDLKRLEDRAAEMRRGWVGYRRGLQHMSSSGSLLSASMSGSVDGPAAAKWQSRPPEWKIKFSTDDFWIELRSRVEGREEAEQRRRVAEAREVINSNEFIQKIKKYKFSGARHGSELEAAVGEVETLLGELDAVVDAAYPCAHASGVGKHRLPNQKQPLDHPNSVAFHNPEFSCGSLEDNSTFVSNLQALRAWLAAAKLGLAAKERLEKTAREIRWESPDLDGLLHRVPMRDVTSLILARAKPALEKLHGLYRDTVREVSVTEINKVNADGTFLLDKTSKKLLKIQQHSFAKQLGDRGMKLPNLASVGGLAGSLAMLPLEILLKIVSSRVAHQPKSVAQQRWWAGRVFQQRFEECVQLLQAGRDYQEELREYLPGVLDPVDGDATHHAAVPGTWKETAERLELQMREVLYMGFSFCSAKNLEVAGSRSPEASGCAGAKQLKEACIDLRREEVPQLVDCLSMFKDAVVAEQTAGRHCDVLELLVRKGRQMLEEAVEFGGSRTETSLGSHSNGVAMDWASEVEQATAACWAAVRVARAGIGVLGLCAEVEFDDLNDLLEGLYNKDYVWVKGDREREALAQEQRQRALKSAKEKEKDGEGGDNDEEEGQTLVFASPALFGEEEEELGRERCTALLKATYGVEGKLYDHVGGHVVRIWVPNSAWDNVRNIWEQNCSSDRNGYGEANAMSVVRLPGLEDVLGPVPGEGMAILTGPNSYTLAQEMKHFRDKLPEGVLRIGHGTRPNRQAVVEAVARVTAELLAVEKSSSALVESWARKWGLVNEAEPNAAWTIFPIMALSKEQDHANHLPLPSIGVSEFSTLQKVFDLAGYTASALASGAPASAAEVERCKWAVARSWALARLAVPRDESRNGAAARGLGQSDSDDTERAEATSQTQLRNTDMAVTPERIKYFEEALRGAVTMLSDEEWAWWVKFFEAVWMERRDTERREDWLQMKLAGAVRSSGGARATRLEAVNKLEEELDKKIKKSTGARGVQKERDHMERMVLRDEHGQKLHWIKLGKLGQGSFGEVFRAQFWQSMDFVAVKQIDPRKGRGQGSWADTAAKAERETRVMTMLKHTNVVRCYGMESAEGSAKRMYMFIEYCAEGNLRDLVRSWMANGTRRTNEGSVVPIKIVRNYTMQLALALQHIHSRGIVHRDIKTMNILVADNGNTVKVADFGEAIEKPPGSTWCSVAPQQPGGSPGHQAPEHLQCKQHSRDFGPKIDVWSLGCVVTEMLTGQGPESLIWDGPAGKNVHKEGLNNVTSMFVLYRIAGEHPEALALPHRQCLTTLPSDSHVPAFLDRCFAFPPPRRPSASDLLQEPFLLRR